MRIDEELVEACMRYLTELERRKKIIQEQERAKEQTRGKWRKLLYEDNDEIVTVIYDHK